MKAIDPTFIIDFFLNDKKTVEKAAKIQQEKLATTTLNYFEDPLGIKFLKEKKVTVIRNIDGKSGSI